MPYKEKNIEKRYYTIGDVAKLLHVSSSLIRFWESEFNSLKPKKNKKGIRRYTKEDIDRLKLIYHLVKEQGYTLQGARKVLKHRNDKLKSDIELIESLKNVKAFLLSLKSLLKK